MSIVLPILGAFAALLLLAGYGALLTNIYCVHVRNKGYRSPAMIVMFWGAVLLSFMAGVVAMARTHHDSDAYTAVFLSGPLVVAAAVLYIVARLLPRKKRIAGTRKPGFPFRLAGVLLLAGGPALVLYVGFSSHWHSRFLNPSMKLALQVSLPLSLLCFYLGKRSRLATAGAIRETDPRPPVLYLRAFSYEGQMFVILPGREASKYTSNLGSKYGATLEQYFSGAIRASIGPFVALGNPFDYLPPEGAARMYEPDLGWQESFLKLARESACIIIQVGASANLEWELKTLKLEGLLQKVFIFSRPDKKHNTRNRFTQKCDEIKQRIRGDKPVAWPEFAAGICTMGYEIDTAQPAPGSIFSFANDGSAVLLAKGAKEPEDYVAVMLERLRSLTSAAAQPAQPEQGSDLVQPRSAPARARRTANRQRQKQAS